MDNAKDRYYNTITAIDEVYGNVITNYVKELEEQNNAMIKTIENEIIQWDRCRVYGIEMPESYNDIIDIIEKIKGKSALEVLK